MVKKRGAVVIAVLLIFSILPGFALAADVSLTLSADSAKVGDSITVSGTADPDTWVSIKALDSAKGIVFFDGVKSDADGKYSCTFKVPEVSPGSLTVVAGYGSNVDFKNLTITDTPTKVTLGLSQGTAKVGDSITASGMAAPYTWISIKVTDCIQSIVFFDGVKSGADGKYSCTFIVPSVTSGTLTVVAGYDENVAVENLLIVSNEEQVPPVLTADTSDNEIGQAIEITFTDDLAWRQVVTGITVDGTALTSDKYEIVEGKLRIVADVFTEAKDYTITVKAKNYKDSVVTQTIKDKPVTSTYTITFNVTGANGTLTAKVDDVAIKSGDVVQAGKAVVFTATPADGYQVKGWTLGGEAVADNDTNILTVEKLAADTTVTVEFEAIPSTKAQTIQAILTTIADSLKGSGADWDVMDMAAYGLGSEMDKDTLIANALNVYNNTKSSATDYERVAISLTSMGIDATAVDNGEAGMADFIEKIANYKANDETPSLGTINAYIFALLAYDSGAYELSDNVYWTREKIKNHLLAQQLTDGGWALFETNADPDVTGMAISALANYRDDAAVTAALDKAVNCLSTMQTANGGFISWDSENSNSASMVIVALSALGIDADTDTRFIKEGKSAIDALLSYKTDDDRLGFTDTTYNVMATEQGFRALVAYTKMLAAGKPYNIYVFAEESAPEPQPVDKTELIAKINQATALNKTDYTADTWSVLSTALNNAILVRDSETATQGEVNAVLQSLLAAINGLKTPGSGGSGGGSNITVTFKLIGDSKHGTPDKHTAFQTWIPTTSVTVPQGPIVYDVFDKVLTEKGIDYDETMNNYIGGIKAPASFGGHWLYEFDNGPNSGWMYTVNGTHPLLGLREYRLKDGDFIVWHYSDDYTKEEGSEKWSGGSGGGSITPAIPQSATTDDQALKEILQKTGEAKLSLEKKAGGKALFSPDTLKSINESKAIVLENKGIKVELAGGALLTEEFTRLASAENSQIELLLQELDTAKQQEILSSAKPGEAAGFVGIGGKFYEITLTVVVTDKDGRTTRKELGQCNKPIKITMDLSHLGELTSEHSALLTGVRLEDDSQGHLVAVNLGGKYDQETQTFTFSTDRFSFYTVVQAREKEVKVFFTDLEGYEWAKPAIEAQAAQGIISGRGGEIFDPGARVTRAEFASLVTRLLGYRETEVELPFADVFSNSWYYGAVAQAYHHGILSGRSATVFDPDSPINRQEMATIISKIFRPEGSDGTVAQEINIFSDRGEFAEWARDGVGLCVARGIITGMGDGTFAPLRDANRAQAAVMLYRLSLLE